MDYDILETLSVPYAVYVESVCLSTKDVDVALTRYNRQEEIVKLLKHVNKK